jgi:type II secretory pathway pseudopilin PulG
MRKFEFNSKFRIWRFRIGHPELLYGTVSLRGGSPSGAEPNRSLPNSELLFQSKGFTLIEIIVLIVMAGILLPAIIVPFATGVKGSGKPEMATTAMYLAHQKMEEFMKFDYANAVLNPIVLTSYVNSDITTYQWQWEIAYVDNNFNASGSDVGYKRILVRVRDPENDAYEIYSVVTRFP